MKKFISTVILFTVIISNQICMPVLAESDETANKIRIIPTRPTAFPLIRPEVGNMMVNAGNGHTVGLKEDGTVVAVGGNNNGQCNVSSWTDIVAISAWHLHTVGLKSDGTVVAVGMNSYGQCNLSSWTDIVAVSAGYQHTVGLKKDGTVVAAGMNNNGQCDVSEWTNIVAISAGYGYTVGLKTDGTVVIVGYKFPYQKVSSWTDIVALSTGYDNITGLKADGTVVVTGSSYYSWASSLTDIVAISNGYGHIAGLKTDGTVVSSNSYISGTSNSSNSGISNSDSQHQSESKSSSTVNTKEDSVYNQLDINLWTDIVAISAGAQFTIGLKSDGTVVAYGDNYFGECDTQDWLLRTDVLNMSEQTPTPTQIGNAATNSILIANPTESTVIVDGQAVAFDAYNINDNNYFKLRDIAHILNRSSKQFNIVYSDVENAIYLTSGVMYQSDGSEMKSKGKGAKTPIPTNSKILLNGTKVYLTAYNIEGYNYFKLRDISKVLNFNVTWDANNNTIIINTAGDM